MKFIGPMSDSFPSPLSVRGEWRNALVPSSALLAWIVVLVLADLGMEIANAYPAVSPPVRWLLLPLLVSALSWVLLAPGVLLLASMRSEISLAQLVLLGFGLSHVLLIVATSLGKVAGIVPFTRTPFLATTGLLVAATASLYAYRAHRAEARRFSREDLVPACAIMLIGAVFAAAFLPELFWQDISDDGFEAVEIGRALQWVVVPRFPVSSGFLGLGIGMITMAWSNHWWMLVLGPIEAAARLPITLHAGALTAGIAVLTELGAGRRLLAREWMALTSAVACVLIVLSFNASYGLYFADISSPPAFEAMVVALFCGMLYTAWTKQWSWFLLFGTLGALARPTALLVGVLAAAAMWLVVRDRRGDAVRLGVYTVVAFLLAYVSYEVVAARALRETAGIGYQSGGLLGRFRFLTISDPVRLLWVILPAGIAPWLAMLAWRWQDPFARVITIVSIAYAVLFLPLAFTNLHQFVPAMLLPLIVYWRLALRQPPAWRWTVVATMGCLLSLATALPRDRRIDRVSRATGTAIDYRIGRFDGDFAAYREALRASESVLSILPRDWRSDLTEGRSGERELLYYAMQPKPPNTQINYVIQRPDAPPPAAMTPIDSGKGWSAFVADTARWRAARAQTSSLRWRRPAYDVSPQVMWSFVGVPANAYDVDVRALAGRVLRSIRGQKTPRNGR